MRDRVVILGVVDDDYPLIEQYMKHLMTAGYFVIPPLKKEEEILQENGEVIIQNVINFLAVSDIAIYIYDKDKEVKSVCNIYEKEIANFILHLPTKSLKKIYKITTDDILNILYEEPPHLDIFGQPL